MKPQVKDHVLARQADQNLYHDKNSKHRLFEPGELEIFGTTKTSGYQA